MPIVVKRITENNLTPIQKIHLQVARKIAGSVPTYPAYLHNHVHIIGAYRLSQGPIYIAPERLERLNRTVNTAIHETAHAISRADDGTLAHDRAISKLSSQVTKDAAAGKFDALLGNAKW